MGNFPRLLALARPHLPRLALATGLLLIVTVTTLALPTYMGNLLDVLIDARGGLSLNRTAVIIGALLVARMVLTVVAGYVQEWVGARIVTDLRRRLFSHLLTLDLRFFADNRLGDITSRLTSDVAVMENAVSSAITTLIERTLLGVGTIVLMVASNWRLTLAIFVTMPLVTLAARLFGRLNYHLSREVQDRLAAATAVAEESLSGIRIVKSFVREPYARQRYDDEMDALFDNARKRARLQALYGPIVSMLFMGALLFVFWLGGREVLAGRLTPGEMATFLIYGTFMSSVVLTLAGMYNLFKRALGASERVFGLLETAPEIGLGGGKRPAEARGAIRFEGVSFGYDPERPILADLDFEVRPGELVALVGVSGVGKSTLVDLIPRYYDVTAGRVLVDGLDVREWDVAALRAAIGSVPQETQLFSTTVRENLAYGRLGATDEEIEAAARAANAHDFILALPEGYETMVGELVALVGVSGVGKSTLVDLIPRYYDVTAGRLLVDGLDVREWDVAALRAAIGSVPQETQLFSTTVRENLGYGRLGATDEEIEAAARAANAHDFIMALPDGYETMVGERGVKLSGGQRQRVAIARALLKEPTILLLDEATSSLDSESERAVQAALDELLAQRARTTLVIAHRLSTIRNADRILVFALVEGVGRLVEQGTHDELLARDGLYSTLYHLQFRDAMATA